MTEPHTYGNKITSMPNNAKVVYARSGGNNAAPRAGIVSSRDINLTVMESWCNRDCAVALARIGGKQTVIVSLYLDITLEVQPQWLDNLMHMINDKNFLVTMGIDSNAHSVLYGPDSNPRGSTFEDFVLQYGLKIENVGNTPTYETRRGDKLIQTHIDVTLSRGLASRVLNWRVDSGYNASDHNTILFEIDSAKPEPELIRPWSNADWGVFSSHLANTDYGIPMITSMKKLDKLVTRTYRALDDALNKACPMIEVNPTIRKSYWATEKHDKRKQAVNTLYKRAKASDREEDWTAYKKADKDFKRMCKKDKNKAWRKYKECIQSEKEKAKLAKSAQWEERRDINVLIKPDGSSTDRGQETIKVLTDTHFPAATDIRHVTYNNRRNLRVSEIREKYVLCSRLLLYVPE